MKNQTPRTIYIAGKLTGLPRWYVVLKFGIIEFMLLIQGYIVLNPVRYINRHTAYEDAMKICFNLIERSDYIYLQFDWVWSPGAKRELRHAIKNDVPVCNHSGASIRFYHTYLMRNLK